MKARFATLAVLSLCCTASGSPESSMSSFAGKRAEAERLFTQGSYQKAHDAYAALAAEKLEPKEKRWVDFRLADTEWRAASGSAQRDPDRITKATNALNTMAGAATRQEDHDQVWAEVQESLGDLYWTPTQSRNYWQAWNYYQVALDWWAGANVDLEVARRRYLDICWRFARPPGADRDYYYGYYGNRLSPEVLANAIRIAKTPDDQAQAHFLMAMQLKDSGGYPEDRVRVPDEFEAALKLGKRTAWYDDALYNYASYLESYGRLQQDAQGNWTQKPDYLGALALYRRFLSEFKKGETRWYDSAKSQAEEIVRPQLSVSISNAFLPGSLLPYSLSWRNVANVELAVYPVSLADVRLDASNSSGEWLQKLDVSHAKAVRSWTRDTHDKQDHQPGSTAENLEELAAGAYVLQAKASGGDGKGLQARDLVLITRDTVVAKTTPTRTLLWVVDATTGEPRAEAKTTLWTRHYRDSKSWWTRADLAADASGLASYPRTRGDDSTNELFAASTHGTDQAFTLAYSPSPRGQNGGWRITAVTDRPAYRPGDKAQWKALARVYDHETYTTPAGHQLEWRIFDPQGAKVSEGKSKLNAFGSAAGELTLTEKMPLGEYRIDFLADGSSVGSATLLRLEEYKLPEMTVAVQTPMVDGHRQTFRVGDTVTAEVGVEYYFGGAVTNADVQVLVYQSPYWASWAPPREYPWFYEDLRPQRGYYGYGGSIIKQEQLKTDAAGKVKVTFDTPRGSGQDFEYRIEARVTDSSRREVTGSGTVRVTRQSFYAFLTPRHSLFLPNDKVVVDVRTQDANSEPYPAEGTVAITREAWTEVWLDPHGKEVSGAALSQLYREKPGFAAAGYQLKSQGYVHEVVETRPVKTDAQGQAELAFTPEKEGYYRFAWSSPQKGRGPVQADTYVWVMRPGTTELGYRHGGLSLLVDKDTVRPGATVPVMVTVPSPERWVLFTAEADELRRVEVLHLTGTVKLVEVKIEDADVPNVFLQASMVRDQQLFEDTQQLIVPPTEHYLSVSVVPDRKEYQARESGTWTVTTHDHQGHGVAAEVSLGVVDDSVYAIQDELAPDPRQFYFGTKRSQNVQTQSSFNQRAYARIAPVPTAPPVVSPPETIEGELQNAVGDDLAASGGTFRARQHAGPGGAPMAQAPAPASASAPVLKEAASLDREDARKTKRDANAKQPPSGGKDQGHAGGGEPPVVVRSDFRATAFWGPSVVTDAHGKAQVTLAYPDSLTRWRATARAATTGAQFGIATGSVQTRLPLLVRLQGPRFFVVGDEVTVSAVANNNTDHALSATASLEAEGLDLASGGSRSLTVPPHGEARADWTVRVAKSGTAKLKTTVRGGGFGDAMEKSFPVADHGIDKLIAKSGKLREGSVTVKLDLPKERREGSTSLTIQVAPSMAVTLLDALPYLIDYPYGCTEQTLSRFVPAAIVRKTLVDQGIDAKTVMGRSFGGIEPGSAGTTHPGGKKSLLELDRMTEEGLKRLYDFQHGDGGWGWWKEGESDRFMSSYVLWGLSLARDAGLEVHADVLGRAASYVTRELVSEEASPDRQAWMLHALATYWAPLKRPTVSEFEKKAFDNLWHGHAQMNAYTRALFALAAFRLGYIDQAHQLAINLENGVVRDDRPDTSVVMEGAQASDPSVMGTAHWGQDGFWWRWSDSAVETTSFALLALTTIDPKSPLVEPAVNWLVRNQRGAQWNNTRDSAIAVLALNQYLRTSGELSGPAEYVLKVNGHEVAHEKLSREQIIAAPSRFTVDPSRVRDSNEIQLERRGGGFLYFSAEARFYSLEEPITPAGHELFVRRRYFKEVPRQTLLKGLVFDRLPLDDGGTVQSGDRVEVVVTVESKNDYEYLLFEDLKPAGFEAVEVKSGQSLSARQVTQASFDRNYGAMAAEGKRATGLGASTDDIDYTGTSVPIYQELRDRQVALFASALKQGVWEMRYTLRAEVPGHFHALPVMAQALYVPELKGNSAEIRVQVTDRP